MNGDKGIWISFLGSYLGAILTLGGVWYQIKEYRDQDKLRAEEEVLKKKKEIFHNTQTSYTFFKYEIRKYNYFIELLNITIKGVKPGKPEYMNVWLQRIIAEKDGTIPKFNLELFNQLLLNSDIDERRNLIELYGRVNFIDNFLHNTLTAYANDSSVSQKTISDTTVAMNETIDVIRKKIEKDLKKFQDSWEN